MKVCVWALRAVRNCELNNRRNSPRLFAPSLQARKILTTESYSNQRDGQGERTRTISQRRDRSIRLNSDSHRLLLMVICDISSALLR